MAVQPNFELERDFCNDDGHPIRTGTLWSCVAHIITAVIGAGVLSLAWSTAQLGWIGGPIALLCFAIITYISSSLLSDCYRSPDSVTGKRNQSYISAVTLLLGSKQAWACGLLQYLSMFGTGIAYVIATATSMRAIMKSNCYHDKGHKAPCSYGTTMYMFWTCSTKFGNILLVENGQIHGTLTGVPASNTANKLFLVFQALGDIAFAYPYALILLEIQDTLKAPPAENKTMKKGSMIAIFVTTFFYLGCGCFGYAAFGNDTPGNLLTGFGFYEPYWLIDFANACIVLHLVGGYQIYSQAVFSVVEKWFAKKYPDNSFVNDFHTC
ncbi:hypothetical protein F8388_008457 [Cannabis sativa]|uniref:Amino acid transporter transmembrane domain-containing protein n=1 Tax=Cannabis sativa TaxID=3483 RepID=A0A7J6DTT4_CANSA|nr:hypothetical protein F8388_008457 [Cannabis sativa]